MEASSRLISNQCRTRSAEPDRATICSKTPP
jgi:hypothetical protein